MRPSPARRVPFLAAAAVIFMVATGLLLAGGCGKKDSPAAPGGGGGGGGGGTVSFNSGVITSSSPFNGIFVHTFNTPGDYTYHCTVHGVSMSGTVHVAAALADSPLVTIGDHFYNPSTVNVKTGSYVRWQANATTHTVTRP